MRLYGYNINYWHTLGTLNNIMATISKRGDYQHRVQIRRKGYPTVYKTFNYLADAESWARMVESEMDRGIYLSRSEAESTTIEEIANRYIREVSPNKKNHIEDIRLMKVVIQKFGSYYISGMQSKMIVEWREELKSKGLAGSTINHHLNTLSGLLEQAIKEWGYVMPMNPSRLVKRMSEGKARDRRILPDEESRILEECNKSANKYVGLIYLFALETTMRQGEIFSLLWQNVDLKSRVALLEDTKNGDSRSVALSGKAIAILKSLERKSQGSVFPCNQQAIATCYRGIIRRALATYLDECKKSSIEPEKGFLQNLRLHDARHEATSRLFEKDLNIMEVSSMTGHKSLQMLKRYTHMQAANIAKKLQ